jgi:hypothetical protein
MQDNDFRRIGPRRYAFTWRTPWGQEVPAEMILTSAKGWSSRPEARNPRWVTYAVGPALVAIRLRRVARRSPVDPAPGTSVVELARWR